MDDLLFSRELAAVLSAAPYSDLAALFQPSPAPAPLILAALAAEDTGRPLLTISGDFTAYGTFRRKGILTLEIRSRVADETAAGEHQLRTAALWTAVLGAQGTDDTESAANRAAAVTALLAALAARGKVTVFTYGPAPAESFAAGIDGEDLLTTLKLAIAWQFTPQV